MCSHRLTTLRASRAGVLLALFALVWLQIIAAGHHGAPLGAATKLSNSSTIDALIASAWCGTSGAPTRGEPAGNGHGASACLHCATSCHATVGRAIAWSRFVPLVTAVLWPALAQRTAAAAPQWSFANRTRGPP